jgi:peptidoglycan/LPS O-acetylase OafA/YrhL
MSASYRPEIDGLRAIAVVAVILFHANTRFMPGGFLGVDIFFLISGYLITGIIVREHAAGRFSIARFYERRARRILPALIVVLLACVPVAWLWMMPDELAAFGRSLVATNIFVSNYFFRADVDYFAEAAELKPLIHTWSLAVEEQFYIFFPLMLVALLKLRGAARLTILLAVAAGSLILAEYWSHVDRASNFYLLPPRAWELLLGSLIAFAPEYSGSTGRRQLLAITGLLMCVVPLVLFDQTMRLPGLLGLVPSVGAALVILFAGPATLVGRCLGARIPVAIGLVSYSAYLWHQPVFVFARLRLYEGIDSIVWPALIALTFALAWLNWRFVENPFRDKHKVSVRQLSAAALPLTAALVIAGAALHVTNGMPRRVPEAAVRFEREASELRAAHRQCQFDESHPFDPSRACRTGPSPSRVAIWGDSHATALASGLMPALARQGVGSVLYASSSCVPMLGYEWAAHRKGCAEDNRAAFTAAVSDPETRTVVLLGRWAFFVEHDGFDNGEGGVEHGVLDRPVFDDTSSDAAGALKLTVSRLLAAGKTVVLVYPIPEVGWDVTKLLSRRLLYGDGGGRPITTSLARYVTRNRAARALLDSVQAPTGLIRIDPAQVLCADQLACIASNADGPLYLDDDHLNRLGAALVSGPIVAAIRKDGNGQPVSTTSLR